MTVREEKFIDAVTEVRNALNPLDGVLASKLSKAIKAFCQTSGDYNFDDDSEAKNRQELMEDKGVMTHGVKP